jgi:hypothetical protein
MRAAVPQKKKRDVLVRLPCLVLLNHETHSLLHKAYNRLLKLYFRIAGLKRTCLHL